MKFGRTSSRDLLTLFLREMKIESVWQNGFE